MTNQEAIEELKRMNKFQSRVFGESHENVNKRILSRLMAIEALEKQTPKKPIGLSVSHDGRLGNCPFCNKLVWEQSDKPNICDCSQKLDWSE
jgi:hypothetical protein